MKRKIIKRRIEINIDSCGKRFTLNLDSLTLRMVPTSEDRQVLLPAPISSISDTLELVHGDVYIKYIEIVPIKIHRRLLKNFLRCIVPFSTHRSIFRKKSLKNRTNGRKLVEKHVNKEDLLKYEGPMCTKYQSIWY